MSSTTLATVESTCWNAQDDSLLPFRGESEKPQTAAVKSISLLAKHFIRGTLLVKRTSALWLGNETRTHLST